METITVGGMDEHEFRHSIEDMLRSGRADEAAEQLRALLEPYAGVGGPLPRRFLEASPEAIEITGWRKLADRLLDHDRPGRPISAIGVVLADARALGGPGPANGRLAPFLKTYYFSDEAYPFTDASRDDLLDGYSRDGFGWQADFQATDATLGIAGVDDLYGAIVTLEDRLLGSSEPAADEIAAGTIGACFLAALIHQSLENTIRGRGLPRRLCVLAACDGVYPFFDAPVVGQDECTVADAAEVTAEAPALLDAEANLIDSPLAEASLLDQALPRKAKCPVLTLNQDESEEALRFTEMAGAQRMTLADEHTPQGALLSAGPVERQDSETISENLSVELSIDEEPNAQVDSTVLEGAHDPVVTPRLAPDAAVAEPARHSLRARIATVHDRAEGHDAPPMFLRIWSGILRLFQPAKLNQQIATAGS